VIGTGPGGLAFNVQPAPAMRDDLTIRPSPEYPGALAPSGASGPEATRHGAPLPTGDGTATGHPVRGPESQEREAAWRRGQRHRATGAAAANTHATDADPALVQRAFAALAENVRDYAVFLMDPDGIIRFWGEGAHLMKRWPREEAEGAHLRLLYPDGGAEDGTAEGHLRDAVEHGESVGEGHRVRGDGTTFWAHVTLTALRADDGTLLGFAKVTRDMTMAHAAETAHALAEKLSELDVVRGERADLIAEIELLKEELAVLKEELQSRGGAAEPRGRTGGGDRS
jgi:PAS domain S-box-containing protein